MPRIDSLPWLPGWEPSSYSDIPPSGLVWARWGSGQPGQGVHGFTDDWRLEALSRGIFGGQGPGRLWAVEPDFSIRPGMHRAAQEYQVYRARYCGDRLRARGLHVVPVLSWTGSDPIEWTAWGILPGSCVAVRGASRDPSERDAWVIGYRQALDLLRPRFVLVFGIASRTRGGLDSAGVPWRQESLRRSLSALPEASRSFVVPLSVPSVGRAGHSDPPV